MEDAMRVLLGLLALMWPSGAAALGLDPLIGRWQGEGALVLGDEPPQRLRCQLRLRPAGAATVVFSGRCATAQGAQSFIYLLSEPESGVVLAENRAEPPDDLPLRMQGHAEAGALRFQAESGTSFDLTREGATVRFVITGHDRRGPARGEAILTPRE